VRVLAVLAGLLFLLVPGIGWGQSYTHSGADLTGPVPDLDHNYLLICKGQFSIEYTLTVTGTGTAVLRSSPDNTTWTNVGPSIASVNITTSATLYLQVYVTGLTNGSRVDLTVSATENNDIRIEQDDKEDVTCHGYNDGSIVVAASCGTDHNYAYSWAYQSGDYPAQFVDPGNVTSASGLYAGVYRITVTNTILQSAYVDVTLTEPAALNLTLTVNQDWSCLPGVGCNGSITVNITGGTNPVVHIDGPGKNQDVSSLTTISDFCAGTFAFNVEDDNGCTLPEIERTINLDEEPPSCTSYPADYSNTLAWFESQTADVQNLSITLPGIIQDENTSNVDTIIYPVDASNFNELEMNIQVSQSNVTTWNNGDSLAIYIDYDGELVGNPPVRFFYDRCVWNGALDATGEGLNQQGNTVPTWFAGNPNAFRPLSMLANNNSVLVVYVFYYTSAPASKSYTINDLIIRGNDVRGTLNRYVTGEPSGCTDNFDNSPTAIPTDGDVTWECDDPQEFWFERTWTVSDDCGNETAPNVQTISIGAYPVFDELPRDTTLDFCNRLGVTLPVPDFHDDCSDATMTWEVTTNSGGADPASGSGTLGGTIEMDFTAPSVELDTTYVITWTVTDEAGLQTTETQNVTILRPISISIASVGDGHFCSLESTSFTVTITGGTGTYDEGSLSVDPAVTSWDNTVGDGSGQFTTSNIEYSDGTSETITISINDSNISGVTGGCPSGDFIFSTGNEFTVHPLIETGAISRD